jgi:hypothetical protein
MRIGRISSGLLKETRELNEGNRGREIEHECEKQLIFTWKRERIFPFQGGK